MKISIITPSFNQADFIEENIHSVIHQEYPYFEHIIIDGGSTDNTLEKLKKYPHLIWISEKDKGQADALNKGLAMAKGEIIGWINSDDYYLSKIFYDVEENFKDRNTQWIVGNTILKYEDACKFWPLTKKYPITLSNLINPRKQVISQQAAFFRKSFLESVGGFDPQYHMIMDFDLWYRMAKISLPKSVDKDYAIFRIHGKQKSNIKNAIKQITEYCTFFKKEDINFYKRVYFISYKYLLLLKSICRKFVLLLAIKMRLMENTDVHLHILSKKNK